MTEPTPAVVGILQRPDGNILLQRRLPGSVFAGYWEFPGGKVRDGEESSRALSRELREEIGIRIARGNALLWRRVRHKYPHGEIDLRFFRVLKWRGEPESREGQELRWSHPRAAPPSPMLPANFPLWERLSLPMLCGVSAAEVIGAEPFLRGCEQALASGLGMIQFRDKRLPQPERETLATKTAALAQNHNALFIVNDDEELTRKLSESGMQVNGLHLSSGRLRETESRPEYAIVGASCHNESEIARAEKLGLNYAIVSPIKKTLTHVDAPPLGWNKFAKLSESSPLPLYALGGLTKPDLPTALKSGAQGIAMMRAAWET